jgi:uncharacterized protein
MTDSKVYFTDMHAEFNDSLLKKLDRVIRKAGIQEIDMERKLVAIKLHFGEYGNLAYLRPNYVKVISDLVKENGGIPFMTDCSTLYVGMRKNGVEHLRNAELNGFNSITTGCQTIIGDGLKGTDDLEIPVKNGVYIKKAKIGHVVADADVIISLNHFKCHELTGIGGAIKNIGMGCASRRGKMELHSSGKPVVDQINCIGCKKCISVCAQNAIEFANEVSKIIHSKCVGCGRCMAICPFDAIDVINDDNSDLVNYKIVEYSKAVLDGKPNFHISIVTDVSPYCDCHAENDMPIIPNLGIFASADPIALDRACIDMAQKQPIIQGSKLDIACNGKKPGDIFAMTNPNTRWQSNFEHAERIGMGKGDYELIKVK